MDLMNDTDIEEAMTQLDAQTLFEYMKEISEHMSLADVPVFYLDNKGKQVHGINRMSVVNSDTGQKVIVMMQDKNDGEEVLPQTESSTSDSPPEEELN